MLLEKILTVSTVPALEIKQVPMTKMSRMIFFMIGMLALSYEYAIKKAAHFGAAFIIQ
jgi:hypothetical protein